MRQPNEHEQVDDGRKDFDFFLGRWDVRHQRLRARLQGLQDWEAFEGTAVARPVLGGLGNIDEITMEREGGLLLGMTLRLFDPATRQWHLYWADSATGILQAPMIGEFKQGVGEFYDQESLAGKAIFSRFIWTSAAADACRWEQAFSADGGRTWETNWVMEFTRRG